MRRGLWKSGLLLAAVALVLGTLVGCSRRAAVREGGSPTAEAASGEEGTAPVPGQTVVSAVASTPTEVMVAVEQQPTAETADQSAVGATATPVPPPTATAESVSATEEQAEVHVVQEGETLTSIAAQYGVSVKALRASNDLRKTDVIVEGQELAIPATEKSSADSSGDSSKDSSKDSSEDSSKDSSKSSSRCSHKHKVKKGEWVWQLARDYDVSPYKILEANNLTIKKANIIQPGTVLCIP